MKDCPLQIDIFTAQFEEGERASFEGGYKLRLQGVLIKVEGHICPILAFVPTVGKLYPLGRNYSFAIKGKGRHKGVGQLEELYDIISKLTLIRDMILL